MGVEMRMSISRAHLVRAEDDDNGGDGADDDDAETRSIFFISRVRMGAASLAILLSNVSIPPDTSIDAPVPVPATLGGDDRTAIMLRNAFIT